jgi:hypothetical protein
VTDRDYYSFTTISSGDFSIDLISVSTAGSEMKIFDKQTNSYIYESVISTYENETLSIDNLFLNKGSYVIKISSDLNIPTNQVINSDGYLLLSNETSYPDSYYFTTIFEETCPYEDLTIVMEDSYGDGWNGNILSINGSPFTIDSGNSSTSNYCFDNTTCFDVSCGGGQWENEVSWEIVDSTGSVLLASGAPFNGNLGYCDSDIFCENELVDFEIITGDNSEQISWSIENENGENIYSSIGEEYSNNTNYIKYLCLSSEQTYTLLTSDDDLTTNNGSVFSLVNNGCAILIDSISDSLNQEYNFNTSCLEIDSILGCTDVDAFNYNYFATINDSSCIPKIEGCIDPFADNFITPSGDINTDVNTDDGSCLIESCHEILITQTPGDYPQEISWTLQSTYTGISLSMPTGNLTSSGISESVCMLPGCSYVLAMTDSYGDGWNGSVLTIGSTEFTLLDGGNNVLAEQELFCISPFGAAEGEILDCYGNYAPEDWYFDNSCDNGAYSYNGVPIYLDCTGFMLDGGDCAIYDCTDIGAINYNPEATHTDSSCIYPDCDDNQQLITVHIYGGEWQSEITWSIDSLSGGAGNFYSYCLDNGCYTFNMFDSYGDGWNGAIVEIANASSYDENQTLISGSEGSFEFGVNNDCIQLFGCIDPLFVEYNPEVTDDDGSCLVLIIEGCINELAFNYDAIANTDNGSCIEYIYGCTDSTAFNYNPLANTDAGNCGLVITGCTNPQSYNYNPEANTDDGNCIDAIYGCTDSTAFNYNSEANSDNESCIGVIEGCTDEVAFNYNDLANVDDGSCIAVIFGCTDPTAFNYDENANTDNSTCVVVILGCTDNTAFNYESEANIDDDSCIPFVFGCTNSNAENFDVFANVDDNSCEFGEYEDLLTSYCYPEEYINSNTHYINRFVIDTLDSGYNPSINLWSSNYTDNTNLVVGLIADSMYTGYVNLINLGYGGQIAVDIYIDYNRDGDFDNENERVYQYVNNFANSNTGSHNLNPYFTVPEDITSGLTKIRVVTYLLSEFSSSANNSCITEYQGEIEDYTANLIVPILGCTNSLAFNYYELATVDDESCDIPPTSQTISLSEGWSMFSTYIEPENTDMTSVLAPIVSNVIIAKNYMGLAYLTEWGFNGIGDIVNGQGYQIKIDTANAELEFGQNIELDINGSFLNSQNTPIHLDAGWNMMGYLRTDEVSAVDILADINAAGNLVIAKNYLGGAYLPEWGFNGLGSMQAGQGYQLKTLEEDTLWMLPMNQEYRTTQSTIVDNSPVHYNSPKTTGNNMVIGIFDEAWSVLPKIGDEIAVLDNEGFQVGVALYTSPVTVITVWGDDEQTRVKEGLFKNESFILRQWNSYTSKEGNLKVNSWVSGGNYYEVDAIHQIGSVVYEQVGQKELEFISCVPNPANSETSVKFYISAAKTIEMNVSNVIGDILILKDKTTFTKGYNEIKIKTDHLDAGSYFINIIADGISQTKILSVVR